MSHSLQPHGLQHAMLPCSSPSPRACSNPCPLSRWCPPSTSSCTIPFSSCLHFSHHQSLWVRWPKYWSFSFNIGPYNEYLGLISFRIDWFDLLEVQEILRHLLQHHSWKASILWCSAFFMVQLSHLYMTTGKNHSFDYTDLWQQSDVSAFQYAV